MNKSLKIEHYLLRLNRELRGLSVSQKAEIITQTKAQILAAMEQAPGRSINSILDELGSPKRVAEKMLLARGILKRSPGRHWFKWLAVSTVAFFGLIFICGVALVLYLSPGGRIALNEALGRVRVGGLEVNDRLQQDVDGEINLAGKKISMVKIPFHSAKLEIKSSLNQVLRWECKSDEALPLKAETLGSVFTLNLDRLQLAKCQIFLPRGIASEFHGVNGHVEVEKPRDAMDISLTNGKVNILPDLARVYDFEVKVKNGLQDFFPPSRAKDAVKVKVDVTNGLVNKE